MQSRSVVKHFLITTCKISLVLAWISEIYLLLALYLRTLMKNTLNILVPKLLIIDSRFISLNISSELINILIQILCTLVIHIITFINWISTTLIISISKYLLLLLIWYILLTLFLRTCNQSVRRVDYTSDSRFITFKYSIS